jgi:hypothetical protein
MGALALSIYLTYTTRTEVGAGIAAALEVAPVVLYAFKKDGEVPADNEAAAIPAHWPIGDGRLVHALRVVDGRIDIEYGASASSAIVGRRLSLTPYETATLEVVWICGNAIPGPGLQPLGFTSGGRKSIQLPSTIESRYLPRACR